MNVQDQLHFVDLPAQPEPSKQPVKKKSKKGLVLFLILVLVIGAVIGIFFLKKENKSEKPSSSNNEEEQPNHSQNEVRSDKISLITEDISVLKYYGDYFEIIRDDGYVILDSKGNTVLENPLYLSISITDGKAVYQGKPLAVSGTFDKYKVYYSTDAPELGYVLIFNAILDLESNKVQNYYIGNDTVVSIYWNQATEENLIVKYNVKTGAVLTEGIIDGYLDFFSWNGKYYLSESHNNIVDLDSLKLVFKENYILGDGPYDEEHAKLVSSNTKYLTASLNGKYGILDASENVVIPFDYVSLKQVNNNVIIAQTKDGYGLINYKNQKVLDFMYDRIDVYDTHIVTVDHNGILRVLNTQYEPLFTGTHKILDTTQNGSYTSQNIREKWNVLAYYHMVFGRETSAYFAILDVSSGKSIELMDYDSYTKVNRSPSGYGYVVFMSNENFSVYDGIVEVSKVNVSEYKFASVDSFYYVGNDYIVFNAKIDGETETKQYFINMKKNVLETLEETNLKQDEILTYDELFMNGNFLKYENGRVNIYDSNNNLLCSIVGDFIERLEGLENYYEIKNGDKVTIIRINEK